MIKNLLFLFCCCTLILSANGQTGYKIDVAVKPFKNQFVYLGYYYGSSLPIKDSIKLDHNGKGTFKGKEKLPGGIYLLGYPNKKEFIELLIDKNQLFSVSLDTPAMDKGVKIMNSVEGIQFQQYQAFMNKKGKEVAAMNNIKEPSEIQQKEINAKRIKINEEVNQYRQKLMTANSKSLLSNIFTVLKEPVIPDARKHPGGKYDSTYAWYFYKSNYWNGIDFKDDRLLRTPVYETKFDTYFKKIIYPSTDSIIKEVDKILIASLPNTEMFKYNTSKLIERYINPEYMGQDAVFVHIFEKYVVPGTANWFTEKQKKYIFDRGFSLIANRLGDNAPPLDLIDTSGNPVSLYNLKSNFTVLCFWDATCGHCKEVVPKLDSIYTAKWKNEGVLLLGVMTDGGLDNWKKYITEHRFTSWVHAYQTDEQKKSDYDNGRPNFRQLYDIVTTPKLYLLDKDKKIIAKQLTYDQIDDVLSKKIQNKTQN
jgi:thiol-disulfide isomerase/thioredoxin